MNGRLVAALVALMVLVPVTGGLLYDEKIAARTDVADAAVAIGDPLAALKFVPSQRESNFAAMGFDAKQVGEILTRVGALEKRLNIGDPAQDTIRVLIDQTDDPTIMENSLCGRASPARYTALQLLVEEDGEELRVRDLSGMPNFEVQDWYSRDRPFALVTGIELVENREPDATRMGLGAVFARQVPMVLDRKPPWGPALFKNWSWEKVKDKWPGVEGKVQAYAALLHLTLENVTGDGGLCRTD